MSTASALKGRRRRTQQDDQPSSRDASEEDNDDSLSSSAASTLNPPHAPRPHHGLGQSPLRQKKTTMTSRPFSDEDDTDSPGHEGDVESSSSLVRETSSYAHHPDHASSSDSSHSIDPIPRLLTPKPAELNRFADSATAAAKKESPPPGGPVTQLSEADIRAFVQRALDGELEPSLGFERTYKVNQPPVGRPVRIYADGVYDLFHFGHALQMRQAKLCFPSVHLIIGVCSDELCSSHKSMPALTHTERCESVRHCKWVDEVAPDAPWEINQEFLDRYEIDYVAHDEEPYRSANKEDVYDFVKAQGRFLPTRRTPGISTSELLERIVSGYRTGKFDVKLQKIGHPELMAEKVHWK